MMKRFTISAIIVLIVAALVVFIGVTAFAEEPAEIPAPALAFTVDLTQIVVSVIGIFFSFLLAWIIKAIVPPVKKWLETRTTAQQREMFNNLVRQLVHAAEQTIGAGRGSEKLKYVCERLTDKGYKIDLDVIEATVKEMNDTLLTSILDDEEEPEEPPYLDDTDDLK